MPDTVIPIIVIEDVDEMVDEVVEETANGMPETVRDAGTVSQSTERRQIDFDDLLPYIGEFGKYQKTLFLLMIPFSFYLAIVYFAQIFITLVPEQHFCKIPELADLSVDQR